MNNYNFRLIRADDYNKGYIELLSQLTTVGEISKDRFVLQLELVKKSIGHNIYVLEHNNKIIATGTLLIEFKIIHNCSSVSHIEDIVVDKNYRGQNIGKKLIEHLIYISKLNKCYKILLDCNEYNKKFYEKCGFKVVNNSMALYF